MKYIVEHNTGICTVKTNQGSFQGYKYLERLKYKSNVTGSYRPRYFVLINCALVSELQRYWSLTVISLHSGNSRFES